MNLGEAIKTIRRSRGILQKELAERIGISANALVSIEHDNSFPTKETIEKICAALDIPRSYLLLSCLEEEDIPEEKRILYRVLVVPLRDEIINDLKEDNK